MHLEKAERLWETLHRIGTQIHHFLLMQDEASGYSVIRRIKVTDGDRGLERFFIRGQGPGAGSMDAIFWSPHQDQVRC